MPHRLIHTKAASHILPGPVSQVSLNCCNSTCSTWRVLGSSTHQYGLSPCSTLEYINTQYCRNSMCSTWRVLGSNTHQYGLSKCSTLEYRYTQVCTVVTLCVPRDVFLGLAHGSMVSPCVVTISVKHWSILTDCQSATVLLTPFGLWSYFQLTISVKRWSILTDCQPATVLLTPFGLWS